MHLCCIPMVSLSMPLILVASYRCILLQHHHAF
ncbi:hypothetical protein NXF25_000572 [Crotalus adamanteus]|uniref:Uncharacterized protein n=1 Tax=Crotalus adamanteus TaxID=8729 RepID=A0AAW1C624_CROAD